MANIVNGSNAAKELHICKHYIAGLNEVSEISCLKDSKDFKDILSKSKSNIYIFEDLSKDIAKLLVNAKKGKYLLI